MKTQDKGAVKRAPETETTLTFVPHSEKPETKNCYRFDEQTDDGMPPKIGTLYVQKWALGNKLPSQLTLTITAK